VGAFEYSVEVGDFEGRRFEQLVALVDTGATYTTIPRDVLFRLGVTPEEERPFILANGERITYGMAWVRIHLDGREQPSLAVFGEEGIKPLLGAFTLEGFGLAVDPVSQRLVPAEAYLVQIRPPDIT
jgi:aspartyl protease family protein